MSDFFSSIFFAVGFIGTFAAVGIGIMKVFERVSASKLTRDERHRELLRKLDAIEFQMKLMKERG